MKKTLISLLLMSTVCIGITPAYANYFSDVRKGVNLNIGSAPNPKPAFRPLAVEPPYITGPNTAVYTPAETVPVVAPAPPPAQAVTEAPPAPPPAIRRFVVFFDFDKSELSVEAKTVVAIAVKTAKETGMVRVVVTGHTDTVGSQSYNQTLSERRAGAVRTEILHLGLDPRGVNATGVGFSDPLVPTGPGVREPQNRRTVIDLGYNLTATLVPSAEPGE